MEKTRKLYGKGVHIVTPGKIKYNFIGTSEKRPLIVREDDAIKLLEIISKGQPLIKEVKLEPAIEPEQPKEETISEPKKEIVVPAQDNLADMKKNDLWAMAKEKPEFAFKSYVKTRKQELIEFLTGA